MDWRIELLKIANVLDESKLSDEASILDNLVFSASRPKPVYERRDVFQEKYGPRRLLYLHPHETLKNTHWFEVLDDKLLGDTPYEDHDIEKYFRKVEESKNKQPEKTAQITQESYTDSMKFYSYQLHEISQECVDYMNQHPKRTEEDLLFLKERLQQIEERVMHMKELYEEGARLEHGSEMHKELFYMYNLTAKAYKSFLGKYYDYVKHDLFSKLDNG